MTTKSIFIELRISYKPDEIGIPQAALLQDAVANMASSMQEMASMLAESVKTQVSLCVDDAFNGIKPVELLPSTALSPEFKAYAQACADEARKDAERVAAALKSYRALTPKQRRTFSSIKPN